MSARSSSSCESSSRVSLHRGPLNNCTEVGVPRVGMADHAIHVRHRLPLAAAAAVVAFGLCLLGPGVPVAVVAAGSIWAAAVDLRTLRIPNCLVLACMAMVAIGAAALTLAG